MKLVVQGGQVIAGKSVQGRKSSLMFICKLILYYDTVNCLNLVNCELFRSTSAATVSLMSFLRSILILSALSLKGMKGSNFSLPYVELPDSSISIFIQLFPKQLASRHSHQQLGDQHEWEIQHQEFDAFSWGKYEEREKRVNLQKTVNIQGILESTSINRAIGGEIDPWDIQGT